MITYDIHVHSNYSTDSSCPLEQHIKKAKQLGLKGICFTDHMDYNFPKEAIQEPTSEIPFYFDTLAYQKEIAGLAKKNPDLELLTGVECGLQNTASVIAKNETLAKDSHWDFILGSLHVMDGKDPYYPEFWEKKNPQKQLQHYFEVLYENIQVFHDFDALGHLDYIVRYAPEEYCYQPSAFQSIVDKILQFIIEKDIALEINTSGYKTSRKMQNPHMDFIKRYVELGGCKVTIGSDAHSADYLGYSFEEVATLLKKIGLRQHVIFRRRKPEYLDL